MVVFQEISHHADDSLVRILPEEQVRGAVSLRAQGWTRCAGDHSCKGGGAAGEISMHDLLIALAFVGMVVAPAIVAASTHPEASDDSE